MPHFFTHSQAQTQATGQHTRLHSLVAINVDFNNAVLDFATG